MTDNFKRKNKNDFCYLWDKDNLQYKGPKRLDHGHPPRGFPTPSLIFYFVTSNVTFFIQKSIFKILCTVILSFGTKKKIKKDLTNLLNQLLSQHYGEPHQVHKNPGQKKGQCKKF